MKNAQRLTIMLTLVNLAILLVTLMLIRTDRAHESGQVLRGRALEIVDDSGRIRASIGIHPPTTVDAVAYPETVLLRLIDPNGGPQVKIQSTVQGGGIGLGGGGEPTYIQLGAKGSETALKLTNGDGKQVVIAP